MTVLVTVLAALALLTLLSGLVMGAVLGGSDLEWSQLQQLLALEDTGEAGDVLSAGADVDVNEALEADDVTEAMDVGRLPSKTNLVLLEVGMGLMRTGDKVLRKSRYAVGGVMGVLSASSFLM